MVSQNKKQIRPKQMPDMLNAILYSKFLAEPKCRESKRGPGTSSTQVVLEIGSVALTGHQRISKGTAMTLCLAWAAQKAPLGAALSLQRGPIACESCLRGRKKRSRTFCFFHTVRNISPWRKQRWYLLGKETATCIVLPINAGVCCAPRGHVFVSQPCQAPSLSSAPVLLLSSDTS